MQQFRGWSLKMSHSKYLKVNVSLTLVRPSSSDFCLFPWLPTDHPICNRQRNRSNLLQNVLFYSRGEIGEHFSRLHLRPHFSFSFSCWNAEQWFAKRLLKAGPGRLNWGRVEMGSDRIRKRRGKAVNWDCVGEWKSSRTRIQKRHGSDKKAEMKSWRDED